MDESLVPDWPLPKWTEQGSIPIPVWMVTWAQKPCDMLLLGGEQSLLIPYLLLIRQDPGLEILKITALDLNPFRSFNQQREDREAWGHELPLDVDILFLTDCVVPMPEPTIKTVKSLIMARKGRGVLTIVQGPISYDQWERYYETSFRMVVSDGTI